MKRILLVNESSIFNSGLGKIGFNLLKNLQARGYEVAELGCGVSHQIPEDSKIPWPVYYNDVPSSDERYKIFARDPENVYGKWRFDSVVLDFKPDYVINLNDLWTSTFMHKSPLRKFYKLILMPTIDSLPLKNIWDSFLKKADAVLYYSDWAANAMGGGKVARYGVNFDDFFKIADKAIHKSMYGIPHDAIVIGNIMKNQPRKNFDDLIQAFKIVNTFRPKTMLYMHTAWPDKNPWNLPEMILKAGIQDKTLFTYFCAKCINWKPSLFKGSTTYCEKCGNRSMYIKNSSFMMPDNELNNVYNCFDYYLQMSCAEGACIPIAEAAACQLPIVLPSVTAMEDYPNTLGVEGIKPAGYYMNKDIESYRAILDVNSTSHRLMTLIDNYEHLKENARFREAAMELYNWQSFTDKFVEVIEELNFSSDYNQDPRYIAALPQNFSLEHIPSILSSIGLYNSYTCCSMIDAMLGDPEKINRYIPYHSENNFLNDINAFIDYHNRVEYCRAKNKPLDENSDYIKHARKKWAKV